MSDFASLVAKTLDEAPTRYRGPGGCVAVVKDGEAVGKKVWGFADLHAHIPMGTDTVLPICSVSKQMLCGLFTDLQRNPTPKMAARGIDASQQLADEFARYVNPTLLEKGLKLEDLCNNRSGIRDYWALSVLWGAKPEGKFSIVDHGPKMIERIKSFQFDTNTQYSYSNTNFFIVARVIERVTEQPLKDLLDERIFKPAGMKTAFLCADTSTHPGPGIGYEGTEETGFYPGDNNIEWAGDAGIAASLDDMIAYEKFVDAQRDQKDSWYYHNATEQTFADGKPAQYSFGLTHEDIEGIKAVGHGGALRGYRLNRIYVPEHRISVVALLNEETADSGAVTNDTLLSVLGKPKPKHDVVQPGEKWYGTYLDDETQLAIVVRKSTVPGKVELKYHRKPMKYRATDEYRVVIDDNVVTMDGDVLRMIIPADNRDFTATRVSNNSKVESPEFKSDLQGKFYCEEIDSTFECSGSGAMIYGAFTGFLGKGPIHFLRPLADDIWAIRCVRAMDSTPPGDWTVIIRRDASGKITGLTIGGWLARRLEFTKTA